MTKCGIDEDRTAMFFDYDLTGDRVACRRHIANPNPVPLPTALVAKKDRLNRYLYPTICNVDRHLLMRSQLGANQNPCQRLL